MVVRTFQLGSPTVTRHKKKKKENCGVVERKTGKKKENWGAVERKTRKKKRRKKKES